MMFHATKLTFVAALGLLISFIAMQAVASDRSIRCGTHLIHGGGGPDSANMYEVLNLTFNYEGRLAISD